MSFCVQISRNHPLYTDLIHDFLGIETQDWEMEPDSRLM